MDLILQSDPRPLAQQDSSWPVERPQVSPEECGIWEERPGNHEPHQPSRFHLEKEAEKGRKVSQRPTLARAGENYVRPLRASFQHLGPQLGKDTHLFPPRGCWDPREERTQTCLAGCRSYYGHLHGLFHQETSRFFPGIVGLEALFPLICNKENEEEESLPSEQVLGQQRERGCLSDKGLSSTPCKGRDSFRTTWLRLPRTQMRVKNEIPSAGNC